MVATRKHDYALPEAKRSKLELPQPRKPARYFTPPGENKKYDFDEWLKVMSPPPSP